MGATQMSARRYRQVRQRVGLIVPSVNATIEPDYAWAAPPGISFHATRVMLRETTPEGLRAMNAGVEGAARLIASVSPDVVAFACTSGSFVDGEAGLTRQLETIGSIVNCPVVVTSRCMVEALMVLGLQRIALVTPYVDAINEAECAFLKGHGLEITVVRGLGLSGSAIREVPPEDVIALVREADTPDAEGVFISCTDFRAFEVIDALERALHKPVLTSNQVTLWGILRALRRKPDLAGFGTLLSSSREHEGSLLQ
jgi:maleate isomerase